MDFNDFLANLAEHEQKKREKLNSREKLIVYSGLGLNWIGDFVGNPAIKWEEKDISLEDIEFSGLDKFIVIECDRSPMALREKITKDENLKIKYQKDASFGDEPIILRNSREKFRVVDGVHRLLGAVLSGKKSIRAFVPLNDALPFCEPHVVYDLIRGYQRNAYDEDGKEELYCSLKLLARAYANVGDLLRNRFNKDYVADNNVQEVIRRVLKK